MPIPGIGGGAGSYVSGPNTADATSLTGGPISINAGGFGTGFFERGGGQVGGVNRELLVTGGLVLAVLVLAVLLRKG